MYLCVFEDKQSKKKFVKTNKQFVRKQTWAHTELAKEPRQENCAQWSSPIRDIQKDKQIKF